MKNFAHILGFAALGTGLFSLGACTVNDELNYHTAKRLAAPAWMIERKIDIGPFELTSFERMHERNETATIYIAGDGNNDIINDNESVLYDPTPQNPLALHLASKDKADNIAYLARPCQYSGLTIRDGNCGEYWGANKYNPEVIAALNEALDGIKGRYTITNFHLVGYDDGATVAALLASGRTDVLSLRTVAGEFDKDALMPHLASLRALPQHHFTGGRDEVTPSSHLQEYLQWLGDTDCVDHTFIQDATHDAGWVEKWPELLKTKAPTCYVPAEPDFTLIESPEPIYSPRIGIEKK